MAQVLYDCNGKTLHVGDRVMLIGTVQALPTHGTIVTIAIDPQPPMAVLHAPTPGQRHLADEIRCQHSLLNEDAPPEPAA